jgi:hypothetical protein
VFQSYTKSKSTPDFARRIPEGLSSQISKQTAYEIGKVVNLCTGRPYPEDAESTRRPWCGRKDDVNKKFQSHHRE